MAYHDQDMNDTAVFEFFARKLPEGRNILVAAGLAQVIDDLESLRFDADELAWLAQCGRFGTALVDSLANLRFTGDVQAVPEGTLFFPDEPILRIVAPLREAQLVETRIVNVLQFQTLIASKAVRVRLAAPGRRLIDFGLRRAHGAEAGLLSARASFLAGFDGTSNVLAHDSELAAFEHFARSYPAACTLLIDTYDTEAAARAIVPLAHRLAREGIVIQAVRLDSGDLGEHARRVREILDAGGLPDIAIFASGNLDEYAVGPLVAAGAPISGFGVGTRMNTSADHPYLDCAYKMQAYRGVARRKHSEGKTTWPGRKQVFRRFDAAGLLAGDALTLEGDTQPGLPLLEPVMAAGRRLAPVQSLTEIRERLVAQLAGLSPAQRALTPVPPYSVKVCPALHDLARQVDQRRVAPVRAEETLPTGHPGS